MDDPEPQQPIGRAPHVSLEEILENPRFPDARKLYLDRFLGVYGHDPFLVRLLIESGRFLVYHLAVVLDAGQDPARRETWFTVGRLKQQIASSGVGASRVRDSRAGVGPTEAGQRHQADARDQNVHCHQWQDCRGPCLWIQRGQPDRCVGEEGER